MKYSYKAKSMKLTEPRTNMQIEATDVEIEATASAGEIVQLIMCLVKAVLLKQSFKKVS